MVQKMISLALVSVLALTVFSSSVSASESEVVFGGKYDSVIKTLPNTSISELALQKKAGEVSTNTTQWGPGGTASLSVTGDRRHIYWSVKPAAKGPWVFHGKLKLRYKSGFKRDVPIRGFGVSGVGFSSVVDINKNKGGKVFLTGSAEDSFGDRFPVLPGFFLSF
ncbi:MULTISPECIES: hypothetical protein [Bacillus]|uniref:hypothetical protein n=1 Tax=Bacillus TaxID=1386 RepID=UPI000DCA6ED9|nr:hypothetical protein [Bacillus altitudinis]RAU00916.1 hypothetical protein DEJ56_14795 [Bacillus altitudinis]